MVFKHANIPFVHACTRRWLVRGVVSLISTCRWHFLRVTLRDNPIRLGGQSLFAMIKSRANMSHVIRDDQRERVSGSPVRGGLLSPFSSVGGNGPWFTLRSRVRWSQRVYHYANTHRATRRLRANATSAGAVQKTVVFHLARPTAFTKLLFARIKGNSNAGLSAPGEMRAPIELSACAADYYELIN